MASRQTSTTVKILRVVMPIVGVVCAWLFMPWAVIWAWLLPLPDSVQAQVDQGLEHGAVGVIVYIEEKGEAPVYYTAGWNNREQQTPVDPNALFKIASITKLYIAVATAKLVSDSRLALDKTLAEYLPSLVNRIENADRITLRMMLQHRSGIPNFTDTPRYWETPGRSVEQKLGLALDLPAEFAPDSDYQYCNTNYLLIAKIIDEELGYSHQQYIKEAILQRLGLVDTYASIKDIDTSRLMSGYYVGVEPDIKLNDYGLMIATAHDVGVFIRAINEGSVFDGDESKIYASIYRFEHSGLLPGYQSVAQYHKDIDTVIVQFVNTTDFANYSQTVSEVVSNRIAEILRRQKNRK